MRYRRSSREEWTHRDYNSDDFYVTFLRGNAESSTPLEPISAPHVKGEHTCPDVDQALAIVKRLQDMHENGFVHGDIRGLNIVFFQDDWQGGEFIDLVVNKVRRRILQGTFSLLGDGTCIASAEKQFREIQKEHDVPALHWFMCCGSCIP